MGSPQVTPRLRPWVFRAYAQSVVAIPLLTGVFVC
jgi:hypothetical protein